MSGGARDARCRHSGSGRRFWGVPAATEARRRPQVAEPVGGARAATTAIRLGDMYTGRCEQIAPRPGQALAAAAGRQVSASTSTVLPRLSRRSRSSFDSRVCFRSDRLTNRPLSAERPTSFVRRRFARAVFALALRTFVVILCRLLRNALGQDGRHAIGQFAQCNHSKLSIQVQRLVAVDPGC